MTKSTQAAPKLQNAVGTGQFFTVAFGAIVGVSWIVLLGVWLNSAGPLGAILAFAAGAVVMAAITLCYGETASQIPVSGGEVAYAKQLFGLEAAYFVGWILAFVDIAVVAYMCIASAWMLDFLVPNIQGPVLYTFRGNDVHVTSLVVALLGVCGLTLLNYQGVRSATRFQDILTYGKIVIAFALIAGGIVAGHVINLHPFFRDNGLGIRWHGLLAVFITTLWFYGGFSNVPQLMEERNPNTSLRSAGNAMLLSVGVAAVFYCLLIFSASMLMPWQALVSQNLPAASAFRIAFHSQFPARAVLFAALCGTFTAANSCFLAGARLLYALGRAGLLNRRFASVRPGSGSPVGATLFVGAVAAGGVFLGRGGILPIVNAGGTGFSIAYAVTCLAAFRMRRSGPHTIRPYSVPGGSFTIGLALVSVLFMFVMSLYQPYVDAKGSFPLEWIILSAWTALGLLFWLIEGKTRGGGQPGERLELEF